jgi:flagellar biosynthetic protein FliO
MQEQKIVQIKLGKRSFMRFLLIVSILIGSLGNLNAYNNLSEIKKVKIKEAKESFRVFVKLDKALNDSIKKPLLGGNYIQYTFPGTFVRPAKKTVEADGRIVQKAFIYQYTKNSTRLRIFIDSKKLNREMFEKIIMEKAKDNIFHITYRPENDRVISSMKDEEKEIKNSNINDKEDSLLAAIEKRAESVKKDGKKINKTSLDSDFESFLDSKNKIKAKKASTGSLVGKLIYSLGAVIVLIFLAAWVFKKVTGKGSGITSKSKMIEFISKEFIGAKNYIAIVKVMDKYLLLGISNDNISTLAEFDEIPDEYLKKEFSFKSKAKFRQSTSELINPSGNKEKNVFKRIINDVSGRISNITEASAEEKSVKKSFDSLEEVGEGILRRRAQGVEKKESGSIEDPFVKNLTSMIKDKVKDMPQL